MKIKVKPLEFIIRGTSPYEEIATKNMYLPKYGLGYFYIIPENDIFKVGYTTFLGDYKEFTQLSTVEESRDYVQKLWDECM